MLIKVLPSDINPQYWPTPNNPIDPFPSYHPVACAIRRVFGNDVDAWVQSYGVRVSRNKAGLWLDSVKVAEGEVAAAALKVVEQGQEATMEIEEF